MDAEHVVLATGTAPTVPPVPGLADGPYWTNKEAIWKPDAPPDSLAVVGAGAVGIEAQIYSRFGTRVTVLEVLPQILPNEDHEAAAALAPVLEGEGVRLLPGTTLERAEHDGRRWTLTPSGGGAIEADEVLVAAGRRPVFDVHDLDAAGIELDDANGPSSPTRSAPRRRTSGSPATGPASSCSPTSARTRR